MTRLFFAAALVIFSLPAFAETYYLDKDAWTCEGYNAIREVERSAKQGSDDMSLVNGAHCMFAATTQTANGNNPTNVMYVLAPYARYWQ